MEPCVCHVGVWLFIALLCAVLGVVGGVILCRMAHLDAQPK